MNTIYAAVNNPIVGGTGAGANPDGVAYITAFVPRMLTILVVIAAIVFFFMLVLGAIKWISSGGDKSQVETARAQITQALTGLVILFSAWAIAALIKSIFGFDVIQIDITSILAT